MCACTQTTATAAPDYNTTTTSSSFASVVPSPGAAAGKPYSSAVGRTCNVFSKLTQQQYYNSSTSLSGNVMPFYQPY